MVLKPPPSQLSAWRALPKEGFRDRLNKGKNDQRNGTNQNKKNSVHNKQTKLRAEGR